HCASAPISIGQRRNNSMPKKKLATFVAVAYLVTMTIVLVGGTVYAFPDYYHRYMKMGLGFVGSFLLAFLNSLSVAGEFEIPVLIVFVPLLWALGVFEKRSGRKPDYARAANFNPDLTEGTGSGQ